MPPHANAQEAPVVPDTVATPDDAQDDTTTTVAGLRLPSVEWPAQHLFCVQYARLRSGLAIFGDAKLWWSRAKDLYDEFAQPAVDAVMVFSGSKRIRRGHVAVVTDIVSPREIIVDHANWQNHGEIDHDTPVLDVSAKNDWSKVRVWDINSNQWGAHVYRISGFIGAPSTAAATAGS
ncbi:MAG TPA: CHAP domain-containing protein [Rhizomicrobium sp.]|nr:CHAP domain-containing protein [Rhizomicrobium sp.]